MNYFKVYTDLCNNGRPRTKDSSRYECHHIIPRCMGGSDDSDNLVYLTFKEHFLAHRLLCKMFPCQQNLTYSLWCMTRVNTHHNRKVTSRMFEEAAILLNIPYSSLKLINREDRGSLKHGIEKIEKLT